MDAPPPPSRPLTGTDLQALLALRIVLAATILLSLGSMVYTVASFRTYGAGITFQLVLRNLVGLLPPVAVLIAVSIRTPPAGAALDAAAGLGIASILFRFGYLAFSGLFVSMFSQVADAAFLLLRLGVFSALDAAVAGLALYLRSRLGPMQPVGLIVAVLAFLLWDGLVQAAMQVLTTLMY